MPRTMMVPSGFSGPGAVDHQRPRGEDIRTWRWFDAAEGDAFRGDADFGQHGIRDVIEEPFRRGTRFGTGGDDGRFSAAGAGGGFDQLAVHGRADAEGEQVRRADAAPDQVADFRIRGDVAIGDQQDRARAVLAAGKCDGALQCGCKFGAAATLLAVDETFRAIEIGAASPAAEFRIEVRCRRRNKRR